MSNNKSYIGYAPKKGNVVKLTNYIQQASTSNKDVKQPKQLKKGKQKRF